MYEYYSTRHTSTPRRSKPAHKLSPAWKSSPRKCCAIYASGWRRVTCSKSRSASAARHSLAWSRQLLIRLRPTSVPTASALNRNGSASFLHLRYAVVKSPQPQYVTRDDIAQDKIICRCSLGTSSESIVFRHAPAAANWSYRPLKGELERDQASKQENYVKIASVTCSEAVASPEARREYHPRRKQRPILNPTTSVWRKINCGDDAPHLEARVGAVEKRFPLEGGKSAVCVFFRGQLLSIAGQATAHRQRK